MEARNVIISKKYVVYEFGLSGDNYCKAFKKVEFKDVDNGFKTEEEAIQALLDEERGYFEFTIMTEVMLMTQPCI